MAKRKSKSKTPSMASRADKFDLYQQSVQTPEHEVEFFEQAFREAYKRKPYSLREDFCGTFAVCCHWVASSPRRTAIGVDLCDETLQWGRDHNLSKLKPKQQQRVELLEQDVRAKGEPVDILAAQNFSFWIFKTRAEVVEYFRVARSNLNTQGVMIMDMMGGGECYAEEHTDKRTIKKGRKGFAYHWTQESFNPITADASFAISFKFPDGSKLKRAFEYHWRFWTIPEVREMLEEAGFRESHVYWEIENEDDPDLDGTWSRCGAADSDPSWICYIVAVK
ncbi:class I SAM-dependent methyltransferase [Roseiconus nitratireducens]|uniref:Class I SAM-dependent methyltransferase n=1 Tax=Roseiconus nitratireducens TaxID=2605748 RepID=A0A5M6D4Y9_9BACT|nr:class I SAM-dependent methyltransferase [Roseiconus nitratireducens]KAA5542554.1 class I SAM-dependent methyltransferase [Roseiconus nitratireducens]